MENNTRQSLYYSLTSSILPSTESVISNSTTYFSSSAAQNVQTQMQSTASISVLMILCSLAIIENIFTCYLIYANKILHTATNTFVFSLCITDILCAGVLLPIAVFLRGSNAYLYLAAITVFTYAANLTAVTYERLVSITKPLQYRAIVTKQNALRITISAWVIPILYCLLPIIWKTNTQGLEQKIYLFIALLVFLIFPLFFICFVYIRILVEVHRLLKENRHLMVYAIEDDSTVANDNMLKRLRKSCFAISRRFAQKAENKDENLKKGISVNEDSNEETSNTCKSELNTCSIVQESPHTLCVQNRHQKHNKKRNSQQRQTNDMECSNSSLRDNDDSISRNKRSEDGKERTLPNEEQADKSSQLCNTLHANNRYSQVNVQVNSQVISVKETSEKCKIVLEEQGKDRRDSKVINLNGACDLDVFQEKSIVDSEICCLNVVENADIICKEEQIALQGWMKECDDDTSLCCKEENSELPSSPNWQNDYKKGKKGATCEQAKPGRRRRRSHRRSKVFEEIRASSAFAAVAFTYMFTWIPVIYMTFMEAIDRIDLIPFVIDHVNLWTIAMNATIDPLFYALILRNFRKVIKRKFRKMRNKYY